MYSGSHCKPIVLLPVLLSVLLLSSCESRQASRTSGGPGAAERGTAVPTLLLISFDGFRADFVDRYPTPDLDRLIESGVVAREGMIPVFPTLTFPNHYSIVTGLYPSHNGMISNTMYDEPTDSWFRIRDRDAVKNSMWWEGEPIWVTAEKSGRTTAAFFWVGSEAPIKGIQPTYWREFDGAIPGNDRVDQVLTWLDLPPSERPSFVAMYFEDVDGAAHASGVDSPETAAAVSRADAYLGRLIRGLEVRDLLGTTNIMVVGDHGMADRSSEKVIVLEDYIDIEHVDLINTSPVAMMNVRSRPADQTDPGAKAGEIVKKLQGAHPRLDAYLREEMPADLHFEGHDRIPEIIAIADEGWTIFRDNASYERNREKIGGAAHGYHPGLLSMRALFAASGPSFKSGLVIDPFENIHLYSIMAHVMDLQPAENDGKLSVLESILRKQ